MKKIFVSFIICLLALSFANAQIIILTNPTPLQRHEVVEIPCDNMPQEPFRLCDAFGIEQPYQLTHDGKLLLFASVRPHGEAHYTIEKIKSSNCSPSSPRLCTEKEHKKPSYVFTKLYPERLDDIVIENDRTGYRFYGPSLQRKGERGYGIDVWLKNTPELIIDSLYRLEFSLHPEIARLREEGRLNEADSLTTLTSFHLNHGLGMDCYNVGPTLGCGTPALIENGELLMPWCYDTYRVIENGPLRVSVQMDFAPTAKGSNTAVTEHRIATLDRGSNFVKMTVWYDGLKTPADACAGFVVHEADTTSIVLDKDYVHYADPTGDARRHNCQIYVATLFPEGDIETRSMMYDQPTNGNAGHVVGIRKGLQDSERFTYYFGSAWSQYDVRSQREWQIRIEDYLQCRRQPLQYKVETVSGLDPDKFDSVINGKPVKLYTLRNTNGMEACITNYGGRVVSLVVPDKNGKPTDVVLGFDNIAQYADTLNSPTDYGSSVGRYANRIQNGTFILNKKTYRLRQNDGTNCLHGGGNTGWMNKPYDAKQIGDSILQLTINAEDGENGFPGKVTAITTYKLTDDNTFDITWEATTNKPTIINQTNHNYYNLSGDFTQPMYDMILYVNADNFTPSDKTYIPTGEIKAVEGTPMDFRTPHAIGDSIRSQYDQIQNATGYDHNFCLNTYKDGCGDDSQVCASLYSPKSGIFMEMYTNEPGLQVYSGNFQGVGREADITRKHGLKYPQHVSVCLESQKFPDSPNHKEWAQPTLKPGETYHSHAAYKFSIK